MTVTVCGLVEPGWGAVADGFAANFGLRRAPLGQIHVDKSACKPEGDQVHCPDQLFYWTSNGPTRRTPLRGDGTFADGSVLLYVEGSDDSHDSELQHEFKLVLTDDPAFRHGRGAITDVLDLLKQFYEHIVQLVVFPRIFTIMSAAPGSALRAGPSNKPAQSARPVWPREETWPEPRPGARDDQT